VFYNLVSGLDISRINITIEPNASIMMNFVALAIGAFVNLAQAR